MHFETDDLVSYFRTREHSNSLPSLGELRSLAKKLYRQYCTTKAYQQALESPDLVHQRTASVTVPRGTKSLPQNRPVAPKQAPHATTESRNSQEVIRDEDAEGSDGEEEEEIGLMRECRLTHKHDLFLRLALLSRFLDRSSRLSLCPTAILFTHHKTQLISP